MKNKLQVTEDVFEGKRILRATNGVVEICIGKDFGPRIFRLNLVGGENVFFNDLPSFHSEINEYRHYGGHRLWHTPEVTGVSSCPDNDPVSVKEEGDLIVIEQLTSALPLLRKMTVRLHGNAVTVLHEIKNNGLFAVETSCWALSQMKPDGYAVLPTSVEDTGLHPNRSLVVWPYADIRDERFVPGNRYFCVKLDGKTQKAFKIGTNNEPGFAVFFTEDGQMFTKKYFYDAEGDYADPPCSFEIYECGQFLEMESFSSLYRLEPGESTEHYEEWTLEKLNSVPAIGDEDALHALFVKKGLEE